MTEQYGGWSSPDGRTPAQQPDPQAPDPQAPALQTPGQSAVFPPTDFQAPPGWGGPPPSSGAPGWSGGGWAGAGPAQSEVRPGVIPLRPLGLGELLDGAVSLTRRYPRPALGFSAAVALVATALNLLLLLTAYRPLLTLDSATLTEGSRDQLEGALGGAALGGVGAAIVGGLSTLVLTGVMTAIAGRAVLGQSMTVGEAWAQVRPALPRLLGVAVLTTVLVYAPIAASVAVSVGVVVLAGTVGVALAVPLVLAGIALTVHLFCRLSLAPSVALLEEAGVRTSLRRSGVLVRRSWWRVCGILLLTVLIGSFVAQIVEVPFLLFGAVPNGLSALTNPQGGTAILVLSSIGSGFAQTIVAPFTAGVRALLYIDRRMRAEGLDVALTAAAATPAS